jgi:autotransporter translocation and assembly factor TamB
VQLNASIPFKPGNPSEHEDSFYEREIDTQILINISDLSRFQSVYDSLDLGQIQGALFAELRVDGTILSPEIQSSIKLDSLLLNQVLVDSVRTFTQYNPEFHQLKLSGTVHSLQKKVAEIDGYIPLYLDLKNRSKILPQATDKFSLRAKANSFDLSTVNDLLNEQQINRLSGELSVDLGLSGTFGQPQLDGFFRLNKTRLELVPQRIVLRDIEADIDFEKRTLWVKNIALKSNTGTAKASGKIVTQQLKPESVDMQFNASNFQISDTRNLKARIDSDLKLFGKLNSMNLTGSIGARGTDIYLENFGDKSVEVIELEPTKQQRVAMDELMSGLTAQVKVRIERDVWVRNREYPELNVELYGETDLIKNTNEEFQLFGTFETRRGFARQFSKRFNLDKGEFTFSGNPINPNLNIETSYELRQPQDVKIWYIIGGTANEPTFTFKSEPSMELEDIVSYTIFGRPFAALMGWQQGIAGNSTSSGSVSDAAVGLLLDRVESYATEKLGVDVIEIDNSASTTGAGTSVRAGKYINQRTFVALVQQLGGTDPVSQVVIEYLIKNNLDLILTQSSDERSGVDIRWRYEY